MDTCNTRWQPTCVLDHSRFDKCTSWCIYIHCSRLSTTGLKKLKNSLWIEPIETHSHIKSKSICKLNWKINSYDVLEKMLMFFCLLRCWWLLNDSGAQRWDGIQPIPQMDHNILVHLKAYLRLVNQSLTIHIRITHSLPIRRLQSKQHVNDMYQTLNSI